MENYGVKTNNGSVTIYMYGTGVGPEKPDSQVQRVKRPLEVDVEADQPKKYCRTWLRRGVCSHGDDCKRLHPDRKTLKCKWYAKGTCRSGDQCPFGRKTTKKSTARDD